jgi:hypothetical protein
MAEKLIAEQEERIKRLAAKGKDTIESEKVLVTFKKTLQIMHKHRAEILAALNA